MLLFEHLQAAFTSAGGLDAAMLQLSKCQGTQVDGGTMVVRCLPSFISASVRS